MSAFSCRYKEQKNEAFIVYNVFLNRMTNANAYHSILICAYCTQMEINSITAAICTVDIKNDAEQL